MTRAEMAARKEDFKSLKVLAAVHYKRDPAISNKDLAEKVGVDAKSIMNWRARGVFDQPLEKVVHPEKKNAPKSFTRR